MLNALTAALKGETLQHLAPSFTAWTTRVSNPVCYPRFRASASVTDQRVAFATGVPPISTHFTATQEFHPPLLHSSSPVSNDPPRVEPGLSHQT